MENKIGIVLSGGGVRGMAHIGLLQALEEHGIRPDIISGSSAGAMAAALYAAGYSPQEMLEFFKTTPLFRFSFYTANKPGLLDSEKYRIFFEKYFPDDHFSALKKPTYILATDLIHASYKAFEEGELIRPLLASAAVPPLFTPVEINGRLYSDGGIMNNFPVEPLLNQCEVIIGSYCNPPSKATLPKMSTTANLMKRAAELRFYTDACPKFSLCNVVFAPEELGQFSFLDTRKIDAVYETAYRAALSQMNKIVGAIEKKRSPMVSPTNSPHTVPATDYKNKVTGTS
ncbi:MAG: patatin-like phospholipase family protein [Bacteroidota bacterium]